MTGPFPPWPCYSEDEVAAVARVLASNRVNYWTGGEGRAFEAEFAAWAGTAHAVALANGTVALELALRAFGIGPGDEVVVSPRSFIASASCVACVGAVPVFADVDRDSGNITAATVEAVLTPRTRAVLPVHLAGVPCEMDPIMALAGRHGLTVIEDCAQAHGARYRGRSVGSIGHAGAWSFCQDKIMTTGGEGGMVTTGDSALWSRLWSLKDHGKGVEAMDARDREPGFRWVHDSLGTNGRMTEMQAALGRIQLGRMAAWTAARARNAGILHAAIAPLAGEDGPVRLPTLRFAHGTEDDPASRCVHAHYRFQAFVRPEGLAPGWSRDRIVSDIAARGVPCFQGSCPEIYLERAFEGTGWRPAGRLPVARELGETSLVLLVHPTIPDATMEQAAATVAAVLAEAAAGHSGRRSAAR